MIATLFYNPLTMPSGAGMLWLMLPLLAGVAIVYKTVRTKSLHHLPREIALLMLYMVAGLLTMAVSLWVVYHYWP